MQDFINRNFIFTTNIVVESWLCFFAKHHNVFEIKSADGSDDQIEHAVFKHFQTDKSRP
jgi:hypothetical protein